jgi:hypothetical protein
VRRTRLSISIVALGLAATLAACGSSAGKPATAPPATNPLRLSLVTAGDEAKAALYPQQQPRYVLDGTLADLGTSAPVRRLVGHDVSEADVARIAATLGLDAAPTRTDWGYEVRDGDALLMVETESGATWIDYSSAGNAGVDSRGGSSAGSSGSGSSDPSSGDGDVAPAKPAPDTPVAPDGPDAPVSDEPTPPLPTIPPPVDVPNADDAVQIAQSLLDDLGVLDGQQWAHDVIDTSTDIAVACAPDAPCPEPAPAPVSQRTVTFDLEVDGTRVPGVGWNVTVGSHRRVEALSGTWAAPEPAGDYALRSTDAVFEDLRNGRAQFIGVQALTANTAAEPSATDAIEPGAIEPGVVPEPRPIEPVETRITGVALGIARWDGTEGGRPVVYLVPTYLFHAAEFHAGSGDSSYDIEVLALDPAGFTISEPVVPEPAIDDPAIGVPPGEVVTQPAPAQK